MAHDFSGYFISPIYQTIEADDLYLKIQYAIFFEQLALLILLAEKKVSLYFAYGMLYNTHIIMF